MDGASIDMMSSVLFTAIRLHPLVTLALLFVCMLHDMGVGLGKGRIEFYRGQKPHMGELSAKATYCEYLYAKQFAPGLNMCECICNTQISFGVVMFCSITHLSQLLLLLLLSASLYFSKRGAY